MQIRLKSVLLLVIVASLLNCSTPEAPHQAIVPNSTNVGQTLLKSVTVEDVDFQVFLRSDLFTVATENIPDFTMGLIQRTTSSNGVATGFIISLPNRNGMIRDLMVVMALGKGGLKMFGALREHNVVLTMQNNRSVVNGRVRWTTAAGENMNDMTITNSRITDFTRYSYTKNTTRAASSRAAAMVLRDCCWACTDEQFNATYQAAKAECEGQWDCDFACSFNPCAIAYFFTAVMACTAC